MKNKSLTPQIRFKGYEDEWVSRPFSEIVTRYSLLKYDETIPSVEYEDINSKKGTLNKDIFSKPIHKSGQYFQIGDILFGKLRPYLGNNLLANFDGIAVGDFWIFKNGLANTRFIYPFLYSKDYSYISNISSGSKMPRSDWGLVSSWNFNIPSSEEEQTLIGGLFANIDKSIFEAEREITRLEKMKQASLQKMFPRPGATTPEIRFNGFTEPWEETTLGNIGNTFTGLSGKTKADFGHGEAKFVTYMNVFSNELSSNHQLDSVEIDNSQYAVQYGDIFFTTSSETPEEVGMSSVWEFNIPNVYLNSFCFGFRPMKELYLNYMAYFLRSPYFRKNMVVLAQGISRFNISKNKAMELPIVLPSLEEQKQIGDYFRNLNALISAKRKKLEKLQNIKQSCLDKMFINTTAQ